MTNPAIKHGYTSGGKIHPLHRVWRSMIQRCTNPNDKRYSTYGARGVVVCDRWLTSFVDFLADVGPRPEGIGVGGRSLYSIDRIDNDKGYEPGNVRWATASEQGKRTTRSRLITCGGETKTITDWGRSTGIHRLKIHHRLLAGQTMEQIISSSSEVPT